MAKINQRKFVWLGIVYPDSAPADWVDQLKLTCDRLIISPLHDKDVLEDGSGTPKKPHYHVIMAFDTMKSYDQVFAPFNQITGVSKIEACRSARGAVKYLIHADDPQKAQYNKADIQDFGDCKKMKASLSDFFRREIGQGEKNDMMHDIEVFIKKYDCYYYDLLSDYAYKFQPEWYDLIANQKTYRTKEYMKSVMFRKKHEIVYDLRKQTNLKGFELENEANVVMNDMSHNTTEQIEMAIETGVPLP